MHELTHLFRTGRYAFGTPKVMPQGSSDVDCVGLVSSSGNAAQLDQEAAAAQAEAAKKASERRTAIIAGVVVPVTAIVIGSVAAWYFLYYRRRRQYTGDIDLAAADTSVKPFTDHGPLLYTPSMRTPKSGVFRESQGYSDAPFDPYQYSASENETAIMRPPSGTSQSGVTSGRYSTSNRRMTKAAEARMSSEGHGRSESYDGPSASGTRATSLGHTPHGEPELVIQHRDGGPGRVRELPPPYADQRLRDAESETGH